MDGPYDRDCTSGVEHPEVGHFYDFVHRSKQAVNKTIMSCTLSVTG